MVGSNLLQDRTSYKKTRDHDILDACVDSTSYASCQSGEDDQ
jgi:hypothetical protein